MQHLVLITSTVVAFVAIDAVWLSTMYQRFYGARIGHLLAPKADLGAAAVFYAIFLAGLTFFVTAPAINAGHTLGKVFLHGAAYGLVTYATYDLTNQATLRDWPWIVTLVDLAWGAFLCGTVSVAAVWSTRTWG